MSQSPEFVQKTFTRVRVFTPSGIIEGEHHHAPGVRVSDALRNAATSERYLLLTNVTIRTSDGSHVNGEAATAPYVLINTQHASVIIPLDEAQEAAAA
jgi:hypothetical protein